MKKNSKKLRTLSEQGHVIIVTSSFPPATGGSSVIMGNLLKNLDKNSFTIVTVFPFVIAHSSRSNVEYLMNTFVWSSRLNSYWKDLNLKRAAKKLRELCKKKNAKYILGVYPDYHFLKIAHDVSRKTGIPLVSYLHDTISEGLYHSRLAKRARNLQDQIFKNSSHIFVMSEGMKDLYKRKYGIEVDTLEHSFPEVGVNVSYKSDVKVRNMFWGGAIYSINQNSVKRVTEACNVLDMNIEIASKVKIETFKKRGFDTQRIELTYYERDEYLRELQNKEVLLLALDWPDESLTHRDELATIFPTKTVEYLHSGRPILVHCPEDYFLAKFFVKYDCGVIVTERSTEKLASAIEMIKKDDTKCQEIVSNAKEAAAVFDFKRVQDRFLSIFNGKKAE